MTLPVASETETRKPKGGFAFGVATFLVVTVLLGILECPDFFHSCGEADTIFAMVLAAFVELLVVILCFAPAARRFVVGFVTAFVVCAVSTCGVVAVPWMAPVDATVHATTNATRPLWQPLTSHRARSERQEAWVSVHRTQHPAVVHAARLLNALHECAERFRHDHAGGGYPRSGPELVSADRCAGLAPLALDSSNDSTRFTESDQGWRWSYSALPPDENGHVTGYAIHVAEDPALDRPAPTFSGDEHGLVRETRLGAPALFAASPVASLVMLRRCLTRVPAYRDSLAAARGWEARTSSLSLVAYVCHELSHHIGVDLDSPNRERGTLAVPVENRAGEMVDTAAVYTTDFLAADSVGTSFELRATPRWSRNEAIHSGTRSFLVATDGSIHVRIAASADSSSATTDDPIAPECLPGGGVDCRVVEDAPKPVHRP